MVEDEVAGGEEEEDAEEVVEEAEDAGEVEAAGVDVVLIVGSISSPTRKEILNLLKRKK